MFEVFEHYRKEAEKNQRGYKISRTNSERDYNLTRNILRARVKENARALNARALVTRAYCVIRKAG